jgi:signal recognition particle GTPase
MNDLDSISKEVCDAIKEALLSVDVASAVEFVRLFNEKINEQNSTKENSGTSRQR